MAPGTLPTPTATVNDCAPATEENKSSAVISASKVRGRNDFAVTKRLENPGQATGPQLHSIIRSSVRRSESLKKCVGNRPHPGSVSGLRYLLSARTGPAHCVRLQNCATANLTDE